MTFSLPNPNDPTNGNPLDATPVLENIQALAQAIQSFDGSQIQTATILAAALVASANPNTIANQTTFPFVFSGLVWSGDSYGASLNGSMTAGTMYYNGIPIPVASISAHVFAASKDTYVDIDVNGNVTYQAVTNNAASPALTASSIRIAIIVTGAGSIAAVTSINQGEEYKVLPIAASVPYQVSDSLGNLICPRDPSRKLLGYRQNIAGFTGAGNTNPQQITALSCPFILPSLGRKVKTTVEVGDVFTSTGAAAVTLSIWDGVVNAGTQLSQSAVQTPSAGTAFYCKPEVISTPTTLSKTYNAGLKTSNAANVANVDAGATFPAFIKVELI